MKLALASGLTLEQFWSYTPREIYHYLEAENERREFEKDLSVYHAWHVALFERQKSLPSLNTVLSKPSEETSGQTPQDHLDWAVMFVKKAGGQIISRSDDNG